MRVLVFQHVESEDTGTLGEYLDAAGARIDTLHLYDGDDPASMRESYDAIVSMGGPMNVYEEGRYPFLRSETEYLRNAIGDGVPVLGICLGAQMIAKAAGASVVRSPKEEIGWGDVFLTREGTEDGIFSGLPAVLRVLQWHGDMFEIPENGRLLASGSVCPHQALRVDNAIGLQFHLEVTARMLEDWFKDLPQRDAIIQEYLEWKVEEERNAHVIYDNFFSLACSVRCAKNSN